MPDNQQVKVRLFFRRANPTGNVSIENSFDAMMAHFPTDSRFRLDVFKSSFYSQGLLPRLKAILEIRRNRTNINHVTGDTNFFVLGLPKKNTVLTIHDCGLLDGKSRLARWILLVFWLKLPVKKCKILTVVSETTKQDVLRYTSCPPGKIIVIPTIIKSDFSYSPKAFNEKHPIFLHIGNAPNKNLERQAAALVGLSCLLHIVGQISEAQIHLLKKYNIAYKISVNLTNQEMQQAYQEADIILFCSTSEGFGMPILEAQTVGRVVVTSNISAMPDVAGNGACLVDPLSISSIRAGIEQVCFDENYRNILIDNGFKNIHRFNPVTVSQKYEAIYEKIFLSL